VVQAHAGSRLLWRAEVLLEDDRGCHSYRGTARDPLRGSAGAWPLSLDLSSSGGFEVVGLRVAPAAGRTLKRISLRLPGGSGCMPALTSPTTRALGTPEGPFSEKGAVPLGKGRTVASRFLTVLAGERGALLVGVGAPSEDFSRFRIAEGVLEAGYAPDRVLERETNCVLVLGVRDDPLDLLDDYGRHLSRFARPRRPSVSGWNSWDYYGAAVTMDDVRREMAIIKASPLQDKLTHCVIDMGWWTDWGDVQPNRRFPATFRAMAKEIEEAGFVPGIWHAPLQCSPWTYLGRHRQDLLVRDEQGGPVMSGGQGLLDWSQPEVLRILHGQFAAMRKAGFRYFKLDYIYADSVQQMRHLADGCMGPLGVIRKGLQTIRDAVGEEAYILNCGAARECSIGITDGSRICTDIHTFWSHIWNDAQEIACHLWENGQLWNIDPDFAVVRSPATSSDPFPNYPYQRRPWTERNQFWMAGPEASFEELKVWLTVTHLCGGDLFLADSIARLNRTGIAALGKLFPRLARAARPLDLFLNSPPRFWLARDGRCSRLGVFNWDDAPAAISVPADLDVPSQGVDVWTGKRVRVGEATVMPPRSAYLLRA
jgi:hypothetical protein